WLPALRRVPDTWVLEPWRMPESVQRNCGVQLGRDIPMPLVDLDAATRQAKQRLHACRAQDSVRAGKAAVVKRHASQRNDSVREDAQQRSKQRSKPHNKQHNQQSDMLAQTADQRRGTKSNATTTTTNTSASTPEAAQQSFGF
ncbi:MAG: FAD-binding domain-containing protein, partial [Burkholderiaceae bacterium]|nr:FAD-binding domain-containing protein [Burkholderiaceae bacterium]